MPDSNNIDFARLTRNLRPASLRALIAAMQLLDVQGVPAILVTKIPEDPNGIVDMQVVVGKNLQIFLAS